MWFPSAGCAVLDDPIVQLIAGRGERAFDDGQVDFERSGRSAAKLALSLAAALLVRASTTTPLDMASSRWTIPKKTVLAWRT